MSRQLLPRRAALLCVLLAVLTGCDRTAPALEGHQAPGPSFRRTSVVRPIMWLNDDARLVFQRVDQWVSGDVVQPTCDSTGLYIAAAEGSVSSWRSGKALCEILWHVDGVDLSSDRRSLLYTSGFQDGQLVRLNLGDLSSTPVATKCRAGRIAPTSSPDGRTVAFAANCGQRGEGPFLHLMNADGSGIRLVGAPNDSSRVGGSLTWSPDGQQIAYVRDNGLQPGVIVITDTLGHEQRVIAHGYGPAWSPTGEWIAYLSQDSPRNSTPFLRLVRPDGTGDRILFPLSERVTVDQAARSVPGAWAGGPLVWSADAKLLAFSLGSAIWVLGLDGKGPRVFSRVAP